MSLRPAWATTLIITTAVIKKKQIEMFYLKLLDWKVEVQNQDP